MCRQSIRHCVCSSRGFYRWKDSIASGSSFFVCALIKYTLYLKWIQMNFDDLKFNLISFFCFYFYWFNIILYFPLFCYVFCTFECQYAFFARQWALFVWICVHNLICIEMDFSNLLVFPFDGSDGSHNTALMQFNKITAHHGCCLQECGFC